MHTNTGYQAYEDALDPFFNIVLQHAQNLPKTEWRGYRKRQRNYPGNGDPLPRSATHEEVLLEATGLVPLTAKYVRDEYVGLDIDLIAVADLNNHPVHFSPHYGAYYWFGADDGWSLIATLTWPASPIDHNGCTCGSHECHRQRDTDRRG